MKKQGNVVFKATVELESEGILYRSDLVSENGA